MAQLKPMKLRAFIRAWRSTEWAILSEDGHTYTVGTWANGKYTPGSFRKVIRELRLLGEPNAQPTRVPKSRRV